MERALGKVKGRSVASRAVSRDKVLSRDEIQLLVAETEDHTIALMIGFLASTGCRVSEMLGVLISELTPRPTKRRPTHYEVRIAGKGGKERVVFLEADLYRRLRQHFVGGTWLFEHSGKQYSRSAVSNRIKLAGRFVLDKNISAHVLRHSFATDTLAKTGDLKAVSKYLGHSSVSTTADLYVHSELTWERLQAVDNGSSASEQ